MKKIISLLMVLVMVAIPMTVFASNFVPSISYKGAPEIVLADPATGLVGEIVGNVGTAEHDRKVYSDCIVVTPVSEASTSTEIPAASAQTLLSVYGQLSDQEARLSELSDELNLLVASKLGNGKDGDDLVVKDLFDVSVLCDNLEASLAPSGTTLDITFDISVAADEEVFIMTYKNNAWSPIVNVVNNKDGTVTGTFENFCPVAIFIEGEGRPDSPETGDLDLSYVWAVVAAVSALLIVAVVVVNKRTLKNSK